MLAAGFVALALAAHPALHVTPTTVRPGATVRVTGNADGCPRGDTVTVISRAFRGHGFAGIGAVFTRVGAGGSFAAPAHVRIRIRPGRYAITARCGGGNLGVSARLRVS